MKAVRMYAPGDLRVEEVSIPEIEEDEVLVKVMAVGICGSDIPGPINMGHMFPRSSWAMSSEVLS